MDTFNGIEISLLIVGLVDIVKQIFNTDKRTLISGKVTLIVALIIGGILNGVAAAEKYGALDANAHLFAIITFDWILRMIAIPGLYNVVKSKLTI